MNHILSACLFVFASTICLGQTAGAGKESSDPNFDHQIVDRAIAKENVLLKRIRSEHPVVETYVQETQPDGDMGSVPRADHYYLGKLEFSKGDGSSPFNLYPQSKAAAAFEPLSRLFSLKLKPQGLVKILSVDDGAFDRRHYNFALRQREFLGNVRTWQVDVSPKKHDEKGRFKGRIWIEDKGFNIVRFNGIYLHPPITKTYVHFDSWRVNCGPDLWLPYEIYSEESAMSYPFPMKAHKARFKAEVHIWGYTTASTRSQGELTNLTVDMPSVQDKSNEDADYAPVERLRAWEHESEDNILERLERANLLAPRGDVDKILDTVVNNLVVTNQLTIVPEVHARVVLTTPLETLAIGHTIVISRGLLDTLPNEASLAAMLAHELAHIALGQAVDTKFAFSDRMFFGDEQALSQLRSVRTPKEEQAADEKALQILERSPYKDQLGQAGLFLRALGAQADRLPSLIHPLLGNRMVERDGMLRLAALLEKAPQLRSADTAQVAALPLGARTTLNPWTDQLRMSHTRAVPPLAAREKMAFELTPVFLNLKYQSPAGEQSEEVSGMRDDPPDAADPSADAARRSRVR